MDSLAIFKRYDPQDALAGLIWQADLSPMANATIGLHLSVQRIGHHRDAQVDRQIRPLAPNLLIEVAGGAQLSSPMRRAAINAS